MPQRLLRAHWLPAAASASRFGRAGGAPHCSQMSCCGEDAACVAAACRNVARARGAWRPGLGFRVGAREMRGLCCVSGVGESEGAQGMLVDGRVGIRGDGNYVCGAEANVDAAKEEIGGWEEVDAAKEKVGAAKEEVGAAEAKEEVCAAKEKVGAVKEEVATAEAKVAVAKEEVAAAEAKVAAAEAKVAAAKQEVAAAKQEVAAAEASGNAQAIAWAHRQFEMALRGLQIAHDGLDGAHAAMQSAQTVLDAAHRRLARTLDGRDEPTDGMWASSEQRAAAS